MKNIERRLKIIQVFLLLNGLFVLFWWPLSHWFYSDFYHQLLGFKLGSYQDSMVKVIGTCGIIPVLLCLFSSKNPKRNRDLIIVIIIFSVLIAATFLYLITSGSFPVKELANVIFSLVSAIFLIVVYPWKAKLAP